MNAGPVTVLPYLALPVVTANSAFGGKALLALRFPSPGVAYYYRSFYALASAKLAMQVAE